MNTEITNISPNSENVWEPESALDILIVLLYSKGRFGVLNEPIEGITRLDKIMFLLSGDERFKSIINQGYTFEADNFGPFASELFDDLEALKHEKIIQITSSREPVTRIEVADEKKVIDVEEDDNPSDTDFSVNVYQLTPQGQEIAELIWNGLSIEQQMKLIEVKKTWQNRPLSELLHFVYTRYPETIAKSKIKDKVLNNR